MERMKKHAEKFGVEIINDHISKVNLKQSPFLLNGTNSYQADTLIIATGASAKYLGLPSEQEFLGRGVPLVQLVMVSFIKAKRSL